MSKKNIFITVLILAVVVVIGAGCLGEKDEVSELLLNLKKQSRIAFGEIVDVEFNWNLEQEGEIRGSSVVGKRIEALGISPDEPIKIKEFFEGGGFVVDIQNIAAGTITGMDGYRKGNMVCSVRGGITGGEQGLKAEITTEDVMVSCGELEEGVGGEVAGLANPAAVYCKNKGGDGLYITTPEGVSGYCVLPDERVCQQWKFFYSEGEECEAPPVGFESETSCKSACAEAGEPAGVCKMHKDMKEGETNLGGCLIRESSTLCGLPDKCFCGCSHSTNETK